LRLAEEMAKEKLGVLMRERIILHSHYDFNTCYPVYTCFRLKKGFPAIHRQTARKYLRDSLPAKPLVTITNRELSKIVFAPAHKSNLSTKPKTIVANIDLYCQFQLAKLALSETPQFKMAIGWEHSQHFVFDIRTSLERTAAILLELNELNHIQQDNTNRIPNPSIAVISPDDRNAHLIREQGYYFYHCTQFKPRRRPL